MKDSKRLDEPRIELLPLLLFLAASAWVGSFIILALRSKDLFLLATIIGAIYTGAGVIAFLHFTRSHRGQPKEKPVADKYQVTGEAKIDVASAVEAPSIVDAPPISKVGTGPASVSKSPLTGLAGTEPPPTVGTFWFVDVKATRGDKELTNLYTHWDVSYGSPMARLGIDFRAVDYLAIIFETDGGRVELLSGRFDLNEVRGKLRTLAVASVNCSGIELWVNHENTWMIALLNGFIIYGDPVGVKRCTSTIQGPESSLYDNTNFKDVAQKLASGLMMRLETGTYDEEHYAGLLVSGWSAEKKNASTLAFTIILKFANVSDASKARATAFEGATQDGQFLRLIVDRSMADLTEGNTKAG